MIDELEESLKDYQEVQKKDEDCLSEMFFENLILSKEYVKSLEEIYFIAHGSFENALQQVAFFSFH